MVLRVQTGDGMKRIEVGAADSVKMLYETVGENFKLEKNGWRLCKDNKLLDELSESTQKSLKGLQLGHGDVIYLKKMDKTLVIGSSSNGTSNSPFSSMENISRPGSSRSMDSNNDSIAEKPEIPKLPEDEIDVILSNTSGLINRKRHPQLCRHGDLGKCLHCSPLEPYDEEYLKSLDPPAKHLSFHAYLKRMKSGASKGKFVSLENVNCKIKPGCKEHPPWPKGICTKCQPSAVSLNRQTYRHVDNIMFENPSIMDRFLNFWRTSGCQRLGYMYGKYEKHDNVPLGIRATVTAIYEPPQECSANKIELRPDPFEEAVDVIASHLGLRRVGWILTDLLPDENGQVKHLRHADTHFLSAQECITAAHYQNMHPNPCKDSPSGTYGSKFVTLIVSGNVEKQIDYTGWQVSNQCMALVNDECLVPTIDIPSLGYIKESSSEQFVPDVFYKHKDSYGNEVLKTGRPMPIEYFLVDVPAGFPLEPLNTFVGCPSNPFPIENRMQIGEIQNFQVIMDYVQRNDSNLLESFLDFHFLIFLMTNDTVPIRHKITDLCKALKARDQLLFHQWLESEEWKTVEQMIQANAPEPFIGGGSRPRASSTSSVEMMETDTNEVEIRWTCSACTFINNINSSQCEICLKVKD